MTSTRTCPKAAHPQRHAVSRPRILLVEDQPHVRRATALMLEDHGYAVREVATGQEALSALAGEDFPVMISDMRMAPMNGLELLQIALERSPRTQVLLTTAYASVEDAVEAMRLGANDYIQKPVHEDELLHRVHRAIERSELLGTVDRLAGELHRARGLSALIGKSPAMNRLRSSIVRAASSDATVLIQGESGTGKELVARALHAHSDRSQGPFVPVNCAAVSETLLESELFGHARGAFTGAVQARRGLLEEAGGGTLFIDEVAETSPAFQAKLLRVLQEKEIRRVGESATVNVDVRIVAATHRELEKRVVDGLFRQDLFYRLDVVRLSVAPLRERKEDIPLLVEHLLDREASRTPGRRKRLTANAIEHLQQHDFPGNVRELENLVQRALTLTEGPTLGPDAFVLRRSALGPSAEVMTLADAIAEAERRTILRALERCPEGLAEVARALDISATTLWRKMRRHGISGHFQK